MAGSGREQSSPQQRLQAPVQTRQKHLRRRLFSCVRDLPQYPIDIADHLREPYWTPLLPHLEGEWFEKLPASALDIIRPSPELTAYRAALEEFVLTRLRLSKDGQPVAWAMAAVHEDVRGSPSLGGVSPWGVPDPKLTMRINLEVAVSSLDGATLRIVDPDPLDGESVIAETTIPAVIPGYTVFTDFAALARAGSEMWTEGIIPYLRAVFEEAYAGAVDDDPGYKTAAHNQEPELTLYRDGLPALARWCYLREKPDIKMQKILRHACHNDLGIDPPSDRKKPP